MRCFVLLFVGCLFYSSGAVSQCSTIDFNLPASTCLAQEITLTSAPVLTNYEWDFCPGDLDGTPVASVFQANAGAPFNVALIEHNGQYYGFYTSRTFGKLFRLDFGTDIHSTPVPVDLGDLGFAGPVWLGIEIVEEGGNYYGFIADYFNKLIRFDLGDSPANTPSSAVVFYADGLLANPVDIALVEDETGKYAFIGCLSSNRLVRVSFATSFAENSSSSSIDDITITGSGNLAGISLMRECDQWYGFTTSIGGGQVTRIHFDSGLADDTPAIGQLSGLPISIEVPGGVAMVEEAGNYYVFIQAERASSNLYRINFGSSFGGTPVSATDLGNLGLLNEVFGFSMYKVKSDWLVLGSENVGPRIFKILFPSLCFSDQTFSTDASPTIVTNTAGTFGVSLSTRNGSGYRESVNKPITVTSVAPPALDFTMDGVCSAAPSMFTPQTDATGSVDYQWDFGDGNTASTPGPSHQFTAGDYDVEVTLTTLSDGCRYSTTEAVVVYDPPQADFDLPTSLVCTYDEETYVNQTPDLFDGFLSYEWLVDEVVVGTQRDLVYRFTSVQDQDVKLVASIPGCSDQVIKTVTGIETGPDTEFTVTGQCEEEQVLFTNTSTGNIASNEWNIDGNQSMLTDITYVFEAPGTYEVTLTTTGDNGCVTELSRDVIIYTRPVPTFSLDLPPFSCAGTPSQFHDETQSPPDSNLESWSWSFGDGGVGVGSDPQHTFVLAGNFQVGLTVTTDRGCDASIESTSTIYPSPDVTFSHEIACEDQATAFEAATTSPVTAWQWKIDGVTYSQQAVSHTFQSSGDHIVQLTATAPNQCQRILEESVNVPITPVFTFSFTNPCEGQATQFTSELITLGEPVTTYQWSFDGTTYEPGTSATHTFDQSGDYPVELVLTGTSGCEYSVTQNTSIYATPSAAFTPTEKYGPAPLDVFFDNTSVDGSSYIWQFNDGSGAVTETSPTHTFASLGTYVVTMQATSAHGCQAGTGGMVYVIVPHTDLSNEELSFVPVGTAGQVIAAVKVKNNSNYPIESFDVAIATGSGVVITETVHQTLPPMSEQTIMSANALTFDPNGGYVCMTLHVTGDVNAANDQRCQSTDGESIIFEPYPNPAQGSLMVQFMGVASDEIEIRLVNQTGADAYSKLVSVGPGLNVFTLDVSTLAPGVYVVRVITSESVLSSRVIIGH